MSTSLSFGTLPPEIRLMIWREALHETLRVVRLNVELAAAVFSQPGNSGKERVVVGGRFTSTSLPEERKDIVWPPRSEQTVQNIGLACWEARQVVLSEYPDLVRVEERDINILDEFANVPKRWTGEGFFWTNASPLHRMLRCNIQTDLICLDTIESGMDICQNETDLSASISEAVTKAYCSGVKLDEFVAMLKQIKHLVIESPWKQRSVHKDIVARFLEWQYRSLFSGTTNLEALYVYRNNIPTHQKNPNTANWDDLFPLLPFTVDTDIQGNRPFESIVKFCEEVGIQSARKDTWPSGVRAIHEAAEKKMPQKQTRRLRGDNLLVEITRQEGSRTMPTIRVIPGEWLMMSPPVMATCESRLTACNLKSDPLTASMEVHVGETSPTSHCFI